MKMTASLCVLHIHPQWPLKNAGGLVLLYRYKPRFPFFNQKMISDFFNFSYFSMKTFAVMFIGIVSMKHVQWVPIRYAPTHEILVFIPYYLRNRSWNNFYGHSPPFSDSRRVVVSYKRNYVDEVLINRWVKLAQQKIVVRWTDHLDNALMHKVLKCTWVDLLFTVMQRCILQIF